MHLQQQQTLKTIHSRKLPSVPTPSSSPLPPSQQIPPPSFTNKSFEPTTTFTTTPTEHHFTTPEKTPPTSTNKRRSKRDRKRILKRKSNEQDDPEEVISCLHPDAKPTDEHGRRLRSLYKRIDKAAKRDELNIHRRNESPTSDDTIITTNEIDCLALVALWESGMESQKKITDLMKDCDEFQPDHLSYVSAFLQYGLLKPIIMADDDILPEQSMNLYTQHAALKETSGDSVITTFGECSVLAFDNTYKNLFKDICYTLPKSK